MKNRASRHRSLPGALDAPPTPPPSVVCRDRIPRLPRKHPRPAAIELAPARRPAPLSLISAPYRLHTGQGILFDVDAVAAERPHQSRSALEDHGLTPTRHDRRPRARIFATPACRIVRLR